MTIKKAIIAGAVWIGVCIAACVFALYPENDESCSQEEQSRVLSSEDYEKAFNDELEKRLKERGIQNTSCRIIAHADGVTPEAIQERTRYTDSWLDSNAAKGVGLGISIATATVDDSQTAGEQIELRFKSFYEVTGKIRLSYLYYINNLWSEIMSETITLYCPFLPEGASTWYSGTVTPPNMPEWSLESIYPNDLCYERELDNGDKTHFLGRMYNPSTNSCTATSYAGNSQYGVEFNFWYSTGRVIDSAGLHSFQVPNDHAYRFVSSPTNNISSDVYLNSGESGQYKTNITIASSMQTWYCTYVITNDRPQNINVVNENLYQTYNNYNYRKYPVYRITNKNYQSYDTYSNYETKVYNQYYIDNGLTIDPNTLKTTIDYTTLQSNITPVLEAEFQSLFDDIYSLQPDIGLNFNANNNIYDYPEIINPTSIVTGGDGWESPSYPAVNTSVYIPADVPSYSTYAAATIPSEYISGSGDWFFFGYDLFDSLGLLVFVIPLVILGLFWRFTGGD